VLLLFHAFFIWEFQSRFVCCNMLFVCTRMLRYSACIYLNNSACCLCHSFDLRQLCSLLLLHANFRDYMELCIQFLKVGSKQWGFVQRGQAWWSFYLQYMIKTIIRCFKVKFKMISRWYFSIWILFPWTFTFSYLNIFQQ